MDIFILTIFWNLLIVYKILTVKMFTNIAYKCIIWWHFSHNITLWVLIMRRSRAKTTDICSNQNIGSKVLTYMKYWKNNILLLLILMQNLHVGNDNAIYDVIMREQVWKWHRNNRHKIRREQLTDIGLLDILNIFHFFSL